MIDELGNSKVSEPTDPASQRPALYGAGDVLGQWFKNLHGTLNTNPLIRPYYSRGNDQDLRNILLHQNDLWGIGVSNYINKVMANQPLLTPNTNLFGEIGQQTKVPDNVQQNTIIYSYIIARDWMDVISGLVNDFITQNNGGFIEFIDMSPASTPATVPLQPTTVNGLDIPFVRMRYLDSAKVWRTGVPEFPYSYRDDSSSAPIVFHRSRVMGLSSLPRWYGNMFGVGQSAAQRLVNYFSIDHSIQGFKLDQAYDGMVGGLITIYPFDAKMVQDAFQLASEKMVNNASQRWNRYAVLAQEKAEPKIVNLDLRRLPEGFNDREHLENMINLIAAALNIAPRELWPHTTVGATKADAEVQERAANQKSIPLLLQAIQDNLNNFRLPNYVKIYFPLLLLIREIQEASLRLKIAQRHEIELRNRTITVEVAIRELQRKGYYTNEEAEFIISQINSQNAINQVAVLQSQQGVFR